MSHVFTFGAISIEEGDGVAIGIGIGEGVVLWEGCIGCGMSHRHLAIGHRSAFLT